MALCVSLTVVSEAVFALDESGEIEAARKAIMNKQDTVTLKNDMTSDAFLRAMYQLLPEGSSVKLSFSKESDFRVYNATSEKDGSIFANIMFTCGPYTRHEMYSIKIAKLSGADAANNADKENLAKDKKAANEIFKGVSLDPNITADDILKSVQAVLTNGSKAELTGDFTKVDSTESKKGSVKCTVKLTLNNETTTLKVNNTLKLLEAAKETQQEEVKSELNFTDVANDAYYANAVKWAVEKNITAGTSKTNFSPDLTCTRAQILTFLWRAVGSPKSEADNPFSDVSENDYFFNAALWAYEKGMVTGNAFEGATPCTRSSTVVYLWKNASSPATEASGQFRDVASDSDYAQAVAWAVKNNVTSGTSDTTFSPDLTCTRGQIVTFLNRAVK